MKCPKCQHPDTKVYDSRTSPDGRIVKRRRECDACKYRFTTMEEVRMLDIKIEKRSGQIVDFDMEKLERGIIKSSNKRRLDHDKIDSLVRKVVDDIIALGRPVIKSTKIGKIVLKNLRDTDEAAYICYWAMFGNFESAEEFNKLLVQFQET